MNTILNDDQDDSNINSAISPRSNNNSSSNNGNLNGLTKNNTNDCDVNSKNEVKLHENLYRMIVSQLLYDGHQQIAVALSGIVQVKNSKSYFDQLIMHYFDFFSQIRHVHLRIGF